MRYWLWRLGQYLKNHGRVEPTERFAANLKALRERRNLTQEDLSAGSGFHPTEISRLERAAREPRLGTVVRLARALGVKPARLLDGIE